jgi:hypothetical protein
LIENCDPTIRRILPDDGRRSDQTNQIRSGRTLGLFIPPVLLLHASPGSGSGVFMQQVIVAVPAPNAHPGLGTMFVESPFAP